MNNKRVAFSIILLGVITALVVFNPQTQSRVSSYFTPSQAKELSQKPDPLENTRVIQRFYEKDIGYLEEEVERLKECSGSFDSSTVSEIDGNTFLTHHCGGTTRLYRLPSNGGTAEHFWIDVGYLTPKSMSPKGNFLFLSGCMPQSDACGGMILDLRNGKSASIVGMNEWLYWSEDESFAFTTSGGYEGSEGLHLLFTDTMETKEAFSWEEFRSHAIETPFDFGYAGIMGVQSVEKSRIYFSVIFYPEGSTDVEDTQTWNYVYDIDTGIVTMAL